MPQGNGFESAFHQSGLDGHFSLNTRFNQESGQQTAAQINEGGGRVLLDSRT